MTNKAYPTKYLDGYTVRMLTVILLCHHCASFLNSFGTKKVFKKEKMRINILFLIGIILLQFSCKGQIGKKGFPIIRQDSSMQCGPVCLQMIGKFYGRDLDLKQIEKNAKMDFEGTSLLGLSEAADTIGLKNLSIKTTIETLIEDLPLPAIAHWNQNHFVIVYHTTKEKIYVADPSAGKVEYSVKEFCEHWIPIDGKSNNEGIIMLFETTDKFYKER